MILRDENATFELRRAEGKSTSALGAGDVHLAADVSTRFFCGRNSSLWVTEHVWSTFISDVRALARRRTGVARLLSMSPADLQVRLDVYDRAGHVRIMGHVGSDVIWRDGIGVSRIAFRIELDPANVAALVTELEYLTPVLRHR